MCASNKEHRADEFWTGADLVVEVVSSDDPKRDLEVKRHEYAQAGISEYWIVDPRNSTIAVLKLETPGPPYVEAGVYEPGQTAMSVLLEGLTIDVEAMFASANEYDRTVAFPCTSATPFEDSGRAARPGFQFSFLNVTKGPPRSSSCKSPLLSIR